MKNAEFVNILSDIISFLVILLVYFFGSRKRGKIKDSEAEVLAEVRALLKDEVSFSSMQNRDFHIKYFFNRRGQKGIRGQITAIWGQFKFPVDLHLMVSPGGIWGIILRLFGIRGVEIGDPDFDEKFFIKSNKPEFVPLIFPVEIRTEMASWPQFLYFATGSKKILFPGDKSLKKPDDEFRNLWCLKAYGHIQDPKEIKNLAEKAIVLADSIEKYAPPAMETDLKGKTLDFFRHGTPAQVFLYYIGFPIGLGLMVLYLIFTFMKIV